MSSNGGIQKASLSPRLGISSLEFCFYRIILSPESKQKLCSRAPASLVDFAKKLQAAPISPAHNTAVFQPNRLSKHVDGSWHLSAGL